MDVMVMLPFAARNDGIKIDDTVSRVCQVLVEVILVHRITVPNQKHERVADSERGEIDRPQIGAYRIAHNLDERTEASDIDLLVCECARVVSLTDQVLSEELPLRGIAVPELLNPPTSLSATATVL